jgi:hypothetical protein
MYLLSFFLPLIFAQPYFLTFLIKLKKYIAEVALAQNTKQAYARLLAMPQGVLAGAGRTG